MSAATEPRVRYVPVPGFSNVYATPTGLKAGARGRVLPAGLFLGALGTKGAARRLRKALRRMGRPDLSGAPAVR